MVRIVGTVVLGLGLGAQAIAAPSCGGHLHGDGALLVGRSETRCAWPFTVNDIIIMCRQTRFGEAAYVIAKGKAFALNGTAKSAGPPTPYLQLDDMRAIAANDTITMPWIKPARELCGSSR